MSVAPFLELGDGLVECLQDGRFAHRLDDCALSVHLCARDAHARVRLDFGMQIERAVGRRLARLGARLGLGPLLVVGLLLVEVGVASM